MTTERKDAAADRGRRHAEAVVRAAAARAELRDEAAILRRLEAPARRGDYGPSTDALMRRLLDQAAASAAICARRAALPCRVSYPPELPIAQYRDRLAGVLRDHPVIIVAGETGSGKTTQIPKLCLELGRGIRGLIGCTQPRRIAVTTVSARVASELGAGGAAIVGYQTRFDRRVDERTRIKFMTDGILLAETRGDPRLLGYDTVMIDEVHERSLTIDFLLGLIKRLLPRRPDLKVIVSSATLDVARFAAFFDGAPVVEVPGRTHPVELLYETPGDDEDANLPHAVAAAVDRLTRIDPRGDTLVFLAGERDIQDVARVLERRRLPRTEIIPLLARLPMAQQRRAFEPGGARRIVLATNVAETSVTIPGIRFVVDSGLARIKRYSHRTQVQRLHIEPVSQASANQRKGRCGRTGPGTCIRLYAEDDFARREPFTPPEIRRTSLAGVILTMLDLKLGDIRAFPFLDPPSPAMVRDGYRELAELGAVDARGRLTDLGHALATFPTEPRHSRMLVEAHRQGALAEVMVIVAGLSVDDPRLRPLDGQEKADALHARFRTTTSDFAGLLKLWRFYHDAEREHRSQTRLRRYCREQMLSYRRMREWIDVHRQIDEYCRGLHMRPAAQAAGDEAIHRSLLAGLLGRMGLREEQGAYRGARGISFRIHPGSGLAGRTPEWVMAGDLVDTGRLLARCVAVVDPAWAEPLAEHVVTHTYGEPYWDADTGFVRAEETVLLYGLPIVRGRRRHYGDVDPAATRALFIEAALVRGEYAHLPPLIRDNVTRVAEAHAAEAKQRRHGLVADDRVFTAHYAALLPADVHNIPALTRWLSEAGEATRRRLTLAETDIMTGAGAAATADGVPVTDYPDIITVDGGRLRMRYRYQPGDAEDGITCEAPLACIRALVGWRMEWLVPGALPDKVEFLLHGLPKRFRRELVPVPDAARRLLADMPYQSGPLKEALARAIQRRYGIAVPPEAWPTELPPQLVMRFEAHDESGRVVAATRGFDALVALLDASAAPAAAARQAGSRWERDDVTDWPIDPLPESVNIGPETWPVPAWPALVADGAHVHLRLFADPRTARRAHRAGLLRLFHLRLADTAKELRSLPAFKQATRLAYARIGGRDDALAAEIGVRALASVTVEQEPWPRTAAAFAACAAAARGAWYAAARGLCRLTEDILATHAAVHAAATALPDACRISRTDLLSQLQELVRPGFIRATPVRRLNDYPRYLRAAALRIERMAANLARDEARTRDAQPFVDRWRARVAPTGPAETDWDALEEYRWMLEEWRVSLFAQEVGTPAPVSAKRLDRQWEAVIGQP